MRGSTKSSPSPSSSLSQCSSDQNGSIWTWSLYHQLMENLLEIDISRVFNLPKPEVQSVVNTTKPGLILATLLYNSDVLPSPMDQASVKEACGPQLSITIKPHSNTSKLKRGGAKRQPSTSVEPSNSTLALPINTTTATPTQNTSVVEGLSLDKASDEVDSSGTDSEDESDESHLDGSAEQGDTDFDTLNIVPNSPSSIKQTPSPPSESKNKRKMEPSSPISSLKTLGKELKAPTDSPPSKKTAVTRPELPQVGRRPITSRG
ncbi:hypothetical protein CYY_010512 [Polysphondylium violaceum]|uniref:Uncharacterized protein n=1 Tax=Polysphondylium violaceum TaxID=133409 RepID=A0A8J4UNM4_9MYCE|nr:hypothetical protein CYY_010512 [Polysphondylium violaceum]